METPTSQQPPQPQPDPALVAFDKDYARKLLLVVAERVGMPVALQQKGIEKMADNLYASGLLIVDARSLKERVDAVMAGKEKGEVFSFQRRA